MKEHPRIVAVNGSPHQGIGNTAQLLEMLRPALEAEGFGLDIVHLCRQSIAPCVGCGQCLAAGGCWIDDDHRGVMEQMLAADAVILASPVYGFNVTGQMKIFLDRCLAWGHKPRTSWKPGLAVSVSAGLGETSVAAYLASMLRIFGAYSVGTLTALATRPGEFWGKPALQARAADLARDLVRNVREKRLAPPTDEDLRFYQFMGNLIESQREGVMRHDYRHWQDSGFYEGFAAYVQQQVEILPPEVEENRKAKVRELMAQRRAGKV